MDHCQDIVAVIPARMSSTARSLAQTPKDSDERFFWCFSFGAVRRGVCRAGGAATG